MNKIDQPDFKNNQLFALRVEKTNKENDQFTVQRSLFSFYYYYWIISTAPIHISNEDTKLSTLPFFGAQ